MTDSIPARNKEIVAYGEEDVATVGKRTTLLNPMRGVQKLLEKRKETQEGSVEILTQEVVRKLLEGISEKGMVSLFHDNETGQLTTEIYSAYFTSSEIKRLRVELWRKHVEREDRAAHERFFGEKPIRLHIQAIEELPNHCGGRDIAVVQRWGTPENDYEIVYRHSADKEAANQAIARSASEKAKFLKEILATEVDEAATADKFGAPYSEGATWSNTRPEDTDTHNAYWVRDIKNQLPALTANSAELTAHAVEAIPHF